MALTKTHNRMIAGSYTNVIDFGADATGAADSTSAIQAAVDHGGGSIFFPSGEYLVQGQIKLPIYTFYDEKAGQVVTGENALIKVDNSDPIFTNDQVAAPTGYTSKWTFKNLSFVGVSATSRVFDMDRIYNSIFTQCVFDGITSVFYSHQDRSGSLAYPDGYIQSAYISDNHFASCVKGVDAKRCFNLDVSNNYFEACGNPITVDGTGDPACSMIRINNNVLEGGSGTPILLGAVFGGVIQGNYFEANSGAPTRDIGLDTSSSFHRGLSIIGNQFQPTSAQKADSNFYSIKIANTISEGRGPVVLGNTTGGPRLISGLSGQQALGSGNYEGSGTNILDQFPIAGQDGVVLTKIKSGFVDNRSTAFDGVDTWKVFQISSVSQAGIYEIDGFLNLMNSGGNLLGRTAVSFKVRVNADAQGTVTAALVGSLDLEELTGARNAGGDPLYAAYWASVTPSFSVSGSSVIVSFDAFTDYSVAGLGTVYSLGLSLGLSVLQNNTGFTRPIISMP